MAWDSQAVPPIAPAMGGSAVDGLGWIFAKTGRVWASKNGKMVIRIPIGPVIINIQCNKLGVLITHQKNQNCPLGNFTNGCILHIPGFYQITQDWAQSRALGSHLEPIPWILWSTHTPPNHANLYFAFSPPSQPRNTGLFQERQSTQLCFDMWSPTPHLEAPIYLCQNEMPHLQLFWFSTTSVW